MPGTVFVIGAGASRAVTAYAELPTPLANEFFNEKYISQFWYANNFGMEFIDSSLFFILRRYFSSEPDNLENKRPDFNNINVEEVYSFLHSFDKVFSGVSYRRNVFETARKQLHQYIIDVIRYTSWSFSDLTIIEKLISKLKPEDSLITFNWDTLIDQALERSKKAVAKNLLKTLMQSVIVNHTPRTEDWDSRVRQLHSGRFIKLHGAINLTQCTNQKCFRHENPYVWKTSEETPAHWVCDECGSPTEEMILAPHGAKTYSSGRFFQQQANLAAEKLSIAQRIVIIGYSFPVFDIEARSMLRCSRIDDEYGSEAHLSEVCIVDPRVIEKAYINSLSSLLGVDNFGAHGHLVSLKLFASLDDYFAAKEYVD
jgi:NAD-dependent SIR2 family protein deacetylase